MKTILYSLYTKSPVIISDSSGDLNMVSTKSYIPANNLIGALASYYIKEAKLRTDTAHLDENFYDWFLSGKIIFQNAYPVITNSRELSYPIPFSLQYEKLDPEKVHDLFFGGDVDKQTKQFNSIGLFKDNELSTISIEKKLNPHHEVDRSTGAVKQSVFFNYESIKEGMQFNGIIDIPDDMYNKFEAFLKSFNFINLGRSKNTQYGKTQLFTYSYNDRPTVELKDKNKFTLELISDTIIYNDNGFSSGSFSDLERQLKLKFGDNIKIENQMLRTVQVENFVGIWNLKKESEIAFAAGSSLLISNCNLSNDELFKSISTGIGERINEGFGSLRMLGNCNTISINDKNKVTEESLPSGINSDTINRIRKIVLAKIEEEVKLKANEVKIPKGKLKNSQLGRIEILIKKAANEDNFINEINNIRDTAKEKYKSCHIGNSDFLKFLTEREYKNKINLKNLISEKNKEYEKIQNPLIRPDDTQYEFNITKLFLTTLLVATRKNNKGGN